MQKQYPHITFSVVPPFSTHPHMVELVVKRIREAMPMQNSSILLVGRGSSDPSRYMSYSKLGSCRTKTRYASMVFLLTKGTPSFTAELKTITSTASHVYVMPYLLFTGLLLQKLSFIQKIRSRYNL